MIPEGKVKIIDFPNNNSREFRIVQLYLDETPYMVCGNSDDLHAEVLEKFLKSHKIRFDTIPSPNNPKRQMPVLFDSNRYRVVGMGKADIHYDIRFFQLPYDISRDYKIGPDKEFNKMLMEMFAGWRF